MNEFVSSYYGELYHHGIKGMKWGVRRYQNADGSLTKAGKERRAKEIYKEIKKNAYRGVDAREKAVNSKLEGDSTYEKLKSDYKNAYDEFVRSTKEYDAALKQWNKNKPPEFIKEREAAVEKIYSAAKKKFGDDLDDYDDAEWYMADEIDKAEVAIGNKYSGYKKVAEARDRFEKAGDNVDAIVKNVANEILDRHADTKITFTYSPNSKYKVSDTVSAILASSMQNKLLRDYHTDNYGNTGEGTPVFRKIGD